MALQKRILGPISSPAIQFHIHILQTLSNPRNLPYPFLSILFNPTFPVQLLHLQNLRLARLQLKHTLHPPLNLRQRLLRVLLPLKQEPLHFRGAKLIIWDPARELGGDLI
jgi:hypothetical protein